LCSCCLRWADLPLISEIRNRTDDPSARVALVDALSGSGSDRFLGVPEALRSLGVECIDTRLRRAAPHPEALTPRSLVRAVDLVVVADARHALHLAALRLCRRVGRRVAVLCEAETVGIPGVALVASGKGTAPSIARELVELAGKPAGDQEIGAIPSPVVRPTPPARQTRDRRVLSCCLGEGSSVGGVATWSARLGRALAEGGLGYDLHTLHIVPAGAGHVRLEDDPRQHLLVFDPSADTHETVSLLRQTMASFGADIILPNYSDITWACATYLRRRAARTIAIAHTDDAYYRSQIGMYDRWDAGVAVSERCAGWLTSLAVDRPVERITYGVPIAAEPRRSAFAEGKRSNLRLAYIGRMSDVQKRVSRLVDLAEALERLGVAFELDLIGDGHALDALRSEFADRVASPVHFVGAISPSEVQERLADIDVSVLVSDYEGASISMLEAMGAGVIPCVSEVDSGATDWITDGENGLLAPVGDTRRMAERLAWLAADRGRARSLSDRAWRTVRGELTLERMASRYAALFDRVMADEASEEPPTDLGTRLSDSWRWNKQVAEDPEGARVFAEGSLRESGFARIQQTRAGGMVGEAIELGCDAVVTEDSAWADIEDWRATGLGVVVLPSLKAYPELGRARRSIQDALLSGCGRFAIYGCGAQTQTLAPLLEEGLIAAFIDDEPAGERFMGLPVLALDEAGVEGIDAVLLASERFEARMWRNCEEVSGRGAQLRALPLFRTVDELAGVSTGGVV